MRGHVEVDDPSAVVSEHDEDEEDEEDAEASGVGTVKKSMTARLRQHPRERLD
jgi:hypothetical protein